MVQPQSALGYEPPAEYEKIKTQAPELVLTPRQEPSGKAGEEQSLGERAADRRQMTTAQPDPAPQQEPDVETQDLKFARIFFVLPEPISLPDGYQIAMTTGDEDDPEARPDDPEVRLTFHQIVTTYGRTTAAADALAQATSRAEGLPPAQKEEWQSPELEIPWTVAEAVTRWDSPDPTPDGLDSPGHLTPRTDVFARCLSATRQVVRAYRHATDDPYGLPTYVRAISPVLVFTADGIRETLEVDGPPVEIIRPAPEWGGGLLMMLDHANLPDPFPGKDFSEDLAERFRYWYSEGARGNPLNLWRERWIEARRAHEVTGEEAQSVILANTSCEVMLDSILALLMWEEGTSVADAVPAFEEGKILRRVTQEFAPRLMGDWSTERGAVGHWYSAAYKLRHRVVHGGYSPSASEGAAALEAAAGLQHFVMDRIAVRRTTYKRAALVTVAEEGLRRRDMWSGQIKRFAEEVAPTEPNWRNAYTAYYRSLVSALTP